MSIPDHGRFVLAACLLSSSALAQDIEPNQTMSQATANGAIVLSAGGTITGTSTGTVSTAASTLATTVDTYRVKTTALPLGIYAHRLTLTNAPNANLATLRGLDQTGTIGVGGVAGTLDVAIQSSVATPDRRNQWYGFGKQEEIYYRVTGTTATTGPYTATLTTQTITPGVVAPAFESANPITIETVGQTDVDTELIVYDSAFNAIRVNDDQTGGATLQSRIIATLPAGTYFLGISTVDLASNVVADSQENYVLGFLTDFPNCLVLSFQDLTAFDYDFKISGSNGTWVQSNTLPAGDPFRVSWWRFTTVSGAATPSTSFCLGDGTGPSCPCGNNATTPGNGCGTTGSPGGAKLTASGVASDETVSGSTADTLVLTGTGLAGPALFFQADSSAGTISFGDGHLCANQNITRMGVVFPSSGVASYPGGSTPAEIHAFGNDAGETKLYQCWYRVNPALCQPGVQNFSLTQGISLIWGN